VIDLAVTLIVLVAVAAVVAWFVRASGITIPQPLLIAVYAVVAVLVILFLARFAGVGRAW
jgi:hypothetical protein